MFWAKTTADAKPGISVGAHCTNVGCVAAAIIERLPGLLDGFHPGGAASLAALHDAGKITCGFQQKCPAWLLEHGFSEASTRERWAEAETDHAKVSQWFLQTAIPGPAGAAWAMAAGSHHGRILGRYLRQHPAVVAQREQWEKDGRERLRQEMIGIFGALPKSLPRPDLADAWFVAGLISIADWIGSNEAFFPVGAEGNLDESRNAAARALDQIGWQRGKLRAASFSALFPGYSSSSLQDSLWLRAEKPGLYIVEGPMGCGKTEAALWAAHRLIHAEVNDGLYFALPTQVTSNRIHRRVARFLKNALAEQSTLRLAHGASWLHESQAVNLRPSSDNDPAAEESVREGRSWFASSKHALLARYGVGTVDQALQGVVAVKHFFVRRFGLAGKVVILDEIHSYDIYTGTLITRLIKELLALRCTVIVLSATLTLARRRELIAEAGGNPAEATSTHYPLLTWVNAGSPVGEHLVTPGSPRTVRVRTSSWTDPEIIEECVARAEQGQHVLYLRNTVAQAQETFRALASASRGDRAELGLLHSRFPFFRRQELEHDWLERLGKERTRDGRGSVLIATQVVEQSVDIDLDFIVTDLAPTDMLLQRMGRLWRHERADRAAAAPEFWINAPEVRPAATAAELKRALGKSGYVYAPYVLLRSAEVFASRDFIVLPEEIRPVLEATYAERANGEEPAGWRELHGAMEKDRLEQERMADAATKVLGQPSQKDVEGLLTRRAGAPTRDLILLEACETLARDRWRITPLGGRPFEVSAYEWSLEAARALHECLVRAPLFAAPRQPTPRWLSLHVHEGAGWALVEGGECVLPEAERETNLRYSPFLGLYSEAALPQPGNGNEHDPFEDDESCD